MTVHVESNTQLTLEQERVYRLRQALERDGGSPGGFLELLESVISDRTWRKVPSAINGGEPFSTLKDFIETKPPFGLGHNAQDVLTLLEIRHPRESVAELHAKLESMRSEVRSLLAADGVTRYSEYQRINEIQSWAASRLHGAWWLAYFVACQVDPHQDGPKEHRGITGTRGKISAEEFSEVAGVTPQVVLQHYAAWEAAAAAGEVGFSAADLQPGQEPPTLPDSAVWEAYFPSQRRGVDANSEVEAVAPTSRPSRGPEATSDLLPAVREAILADPEAAEIAHSAIMARLVEDVDLQAAMAQSVASQPVLRRALAAERRRARQVEFVRKAAEEGTARSRAGITVELPKQPRARAVAQFGLAGPSAGASDVESAYEAVRELVEEVVDSDPEVFAQVQLSKVHKALTTTAKNIDSIDVGALAEVADDGVREAIAALKVKINELATLFPSGQSEITRSGS